MQEDFRKCNVFLSSKLAVSSRNAQHPLAPPQLPQQLSSREQPFISLSHSRGYRPTSPCTPLHATSQNRSCRCLRAAYIAGGAKWRTTSTVRPLFSAVGSLLNTVVPVLFCIVFTDLQGSINRIHRTIELMYSDKTMLQVGATST